MTVRLPKPKSAARILRSALAQKGLELGASQALDVVAQIYGYESWYAMQQDPAAQESAAVTQAGKGQFRLREEVAQEGCHIRVRNIDIAVTGSNSYLSVELWPAEKPGPRPLDSCGAVFAEAAKDHVNPNPRLPFYGCELPFAIVALEFVSSDARALDWSRREPARYVLEGLAEWINEGMDDDSYDLSETLIECDGEEWSGEDLADAQLDADGRFTLKDGKEFYLIGENHRRWAPLKRV